MDFIRLSNRIVNLALIEQIIFEGNSMLIYWQGGNRSDLDELDTAILLDYLEQQCGVMSAPAARLWLQREISPLP